MGKLLDLEEERRHLVAKKGFESWTRRFSESFGANTAMGDISDRTLSALIQSGEESAMPLYDLIMGILGLGKGPRFYSLEARQIMLVTDITLFLLDQLRFEAMRRLGWIEDSPTFHIPLLDIVQQFKSRFSAIKHETPPLAKNHRYFKEYEETFEGDRGGFVRKLIPEVIKIFQERELVT